MGTYWLKVFAEKKRRRPVTNRRRSLRSTAGRQKGANTTDILRQSTKPQKEQESQRPECPDNSNDKRLTVSVHAHYVGRHPPDGVHGEAYGFSVRTEDHDQSLKLLWCPKVMNHTFDK